MRYIKEKYNYANETALLEAHGSFMTRYEKRVKRQLIKLLQDDGKGHHHAMYAERLKDFFVKVVPVGSTEVRTAAISFDTGTIYINQGFLGDPTTFYQLNVIIRHELLHNLLMHEIRMMNKIGKYPYSHIKTSSSLHDLLNIIEDFEISNKKYSAEDKDIVRHTWLNGTLISGLVTEDSRPNWVMMSVEGMYDAIVKELENLSAKYDDLQTRNLDNDFRAGKTAPDEFVNNSMMSALSLYKDRSTPASIEGTDLKDFIAGKTVLLCGGGNSCKFTDMADRYQNIVTSLSTNIDDDAVNGYNEDDIEAFIKDIARSRAFTTFKLTYKNGKSIDLCTPEDKSIAIEVLKFMVGNNIDNYNNYAWYQQVYKTLDKYNLSDDELKQILDGITQGV